MAFMGFMSLIGRQTPKGTRQRIHESKVALNASTLILVAHGLGFRA